MGSTTPTEEITRRRNPIEINSAEACRISGNKILMKEALVKAGCSTAEYFTLTEVDRNKIQEYLAEFGVIIAKRVNSSKGKGIYLIDNDEGIDAFLFEIRNDSIEKYIFEKFYKYSREYRLHVTKEGCFYAARKMLKHDAQVRWHRHAENSVWFKEENPLFRKPDNWGIIVEDCIKGLNAIGLDIGAFDVKVQTTDKNPKYIILESNSAPALGEIGIQKYKDMLTKMIQDVKV